LRRFILALSAAAVVMVASPANQIIIDSDTGEFGDDGVAVTMLLRSGRARDVTGITTIAGNAHLSSVTAFMEHIVSLLEVRPPIHAGAWAPLIHSAAMAQVEAKRWGPLDWTGALGVPMTGNSSSRKPDARAIDFIADTIRKKSSGATTVLAIGPLTNIALAMRVHPLDEIGELVFMGGAIKAPGNANKTAEFNFWFDPEAAQIVLRSAIPRKVMFALDVCNTAKVTKAIFDEIVAVKTPITQLYRKDFGERYPAFLKNPMTSGALWDELAAAYVIDPTIATASEKKYLDVVTEFGPNYGKVIDLDRELAPGATPVEVVTAVDLAKVFAIYKRALTRSSASTPGTLP
jgi:inosine-uridine nucleoside N-ribohydrolase